jgi:hypothetical protein
VVRWFCCVCIRLFGVLIGITRCYLISGICIWLPTQDSEDLNYTVTVGCQVKDVRSAEYRLVS